MDHNFMVGVTYDTRNPGHSVYNQYNSFRHCPLGRARLSILQAGGFNIPQILFTEEELSRLQELQDKKAALSIQYQDVAKIRVIFLEQNTNLLIDLSTQIHAVNTEIAKITQAGN